MFSVTFQMARKKERMDILFRVCAACLCPLHAREGGSGKKKAVICITA